MDLQLTGRAALITGGSGGIGLRTARCLAAEGCHLGLMARNDAALAAAEAELTATGVKVVTVAGSVAEADDAERFVETCAARLGRLDILINNAIDYDFGEVRSRDAATTDDQVWRAAFDGIVLQALRLIRFAVPHLRKSDAAAVVNVSSISGWLPQLAGSGPYGGAKAMLIELTERLALERAGDGIRVNTVSPGSIFWPGGSWDSFRQANPESFAAYVADGFPMGRLGHPEEVADVIAFLASPRANWINGRHIPVDGLEQPTPVRDFRPW